MKIFLLIFFITFTHSAFAAKLTNRECNEVASIVNQSSSNMHLDSITILKNASCSSQAHLRYNYSVDTDFSKSEFKDAIPTLKNPNMTTWCTHPDLKPLLVLLDSVEFSYSKPNGEYLGAYGFNERSCRGYEN